MKKNLLVVLAAVLSLGISSCNGGSNDSSKPVENSSSTLPSEDSSSSSTAPDEVDFTEEELEAAKTYLETNKSTCALSGEFNEFCTEGQKELVLPKAHYNRTNNVGDVTIMDGTGTIQEALPTKEDGTGAFDSEDHMDFRDWKLNACTIVPKSSLCTADVAANKYDEANIWNFRVMVDAEGKIAAIYSGGNMTLNPEPYFSNFEYNKANNNNMFIELKSEDRSANDTANPSGANHAYVWQVLDGGFNIVEHSDHVNGRHVEYAFTNSSEVDIVSWAFMGASYDVGTFERSDNHYSEPGNMFSEVIERESPVYFHKLASAGYGASLSKKFIPGQFDDVRISFEEEKNENGVGTGNYLIKETFEYDPYTTFLKFKAYKDFLGNAFDSSDEYTEELDNLWTAIDNETEVLEAIYALNTEKVRLSGDEALIAQYTDLAVAELKAYKQAIIDFRYAFYDILEA